METTRNAAVPYTGGEYDTLVKHVPDDVISRLNKVITFE
jgi:hypothetical protein